MTYGLDALLPAAMTGPGGPPRDWSRRPTGVKRDDR